MKIKVVCIQTSSSQFPKKNIERFQVELLEPIVQYTFSRLYPYILGTSIIFFLIFILAILIFILTLKIYKNLYFLTKR